MWITRSSRECGGCAEVIDKVGPAAAADVCIQQAHRNRCAAAAAAAAATAGAAAATQPQPSRLISRAVGRLQGSCHGVSGATRTCAALSESTSSGL